jgi:hypothetical protein
MMLHTILTQKLCQTLCETHIVGKFVQIPLCTILTQEQEVILQLSRVLHIPWRCFGWYGKWCNRRGTVASKGSFLLVGLLTRRDWAVDEEGGWLYDKKGSWWGDSGCGGTKHLHGVNISHATGPSMWVTQWPKSKQTYLVMSWMLPGLGCEASCGTQLASVQFCYRTVWISLSLLT